MDLDTASVSLGLSWQLFAALWVVPALFIAVRRLPLAVLRAEPRLQHMLYAAAVILMLTWSFRAGLSAGLSIHFLGVEYPFLGYNNTCSGVWLGSGVTRRIRCVSASQFDRG